MLGSTRSTHSRWRFALASGVAMGFAVPASAAMTWTQANSADANTIALFHFDEGSGTKATNQASGGPNGTLSATRMYASENSGHWRAGGAGTYIEAAENRSTAPDPDTFDPDQMDNLNLSGIDYNQGAAP